MRRKLLLLRQLLVRGAVHPNRLRHRRDRRHLRLGVFQFVHEVVLRFVVSQAGAANPGFLFQIERLELVRNLVVALVAVEQVRPNLVLVVEGRVFHAGRLGFLAGHTVGLAAEQRHRELLVLLWLLNRQIT